VWHDPSKWWPVHRAEQEIQAEVRKCLAWAFKTCDVRSETSGAMGRLDISVSQPFVMNNNPGPVKAVVIHALLELKVVKSFTSNGSQTSQTTEKLKFSEGILQAAAYSKEN